jgi:hypothetical protein
MNDVETEQVEETKLLWVTLNCKLSWSKHINTTVARMGRSMSIIKPCSAFLTSLSTRQVLRPTFCSNLDYCLVVWSGATKRDLGNCNWLRTGQQSWPLVVHHELTLIICMSISPGSKWWRNWLDQYLYLLNAPSCLFELMAHSSDTHAYATRQVTKGLFTVPKSKTDYGRRTMLHGSIPHQVTHASRKNRFKNKIKIHLMGQRGLWSNTSIGTDTCIQTHDNNVRAIHIRTHGFCVVVE